MSAARCNVCLVNFPPEMDAVECPVCDIGCLDTIRDAEPDFDWQDQANKAEFIRYYTRTRGHHPDSEPPATSTDRESTGRPASKWGR